MLDRGEHRRSPSQTQPSCGRREQDRPSPGSLDHVEGTATIGYSHNTDLLGHFTIDPPLNPAGCEWLMTYSEPRRCDRPDGPYAVLGNPAVREPYDDIAAFDRPSPYEPGSNCGWVPCADGCCLSYDGREKFNSPARGVCPYLIDQFLRPGAVAASSGHRRL